MSDFFFASGKWFSYNWDITVVVCFITIIMLIQTVYLFRQKIGKYLIIISWCVYVVFCGISIACVDYMGRVERQTGSARLLELATTCAQAVELDGHAKLTFDTPRDDPTWVHLMQMLFEWGDKNKRVASIYTIRVKKHLDESGDVIEEPVFFLCPEADFNQDRIFTKPEEDEVPAGTPYTAPSEQFLRETQSGKAYFAEELVIDKWGKWYTAGAPLFDESNRVVGILCVDFWPEVWQADILKARVWPLALFGTFLVMFFVVVNFIARLITTVRSLTVANIKAEEAALVKSRFLANMSHEIRTPINAILGFLQILVGRHGDWNREELDMFEQIDKNSKDLLTIIDDILTFSKIDAGNMTIESVSVSPRRILDDVEKAMRPRFEANPNVEFSTKTIGEIPATILSDPTRLRQIITNLVGNAAKFTSEGSVTVCCERLDEPVGNDNSVRLRFSVIDMGIGIDRNTLAKLFKPFTQADSSSTRKYGGTGLGLSISKRLAELLGGTLTVESEPNKGSRFDLVLNAVLPPEKQEVRTDSLKKILNPASVNDNSQSLSNRRFLVVDDSKINQIVLATSLKDRGAEVETAENGLVAIDLVAVSERSNRPFDLVFMDMQMPIMSGIEATQKLRLQGCNRPIIAVTANAFAEDRQLALDCGCNDYLPKPLNIPEMLNLVHRFLDDK